MANSDLGICARLTEVRIHRYGDRGRSAFARELGVPVSSYVIYEQNRIPPVELLIRAAELGGVNLEWLLTGNGDREAVTRQDQKSSEVSPLAQRVTELLRRRPDLAQQFEQVLALLEQIPTLPVAARPPSVKSQHLIPVLGSTAAGTARFWEELPEIPGGADVDGRLEKLLEQHGLNQLRDGQFSESTGTSPADDGTVSLVQYSTPNELGVLEFLQAPALKKKYPLAVAWRIDGESMLPRYRHGDLVVTSPDQAAVENSPCVARQADQIGVNCKIFQRIGDEILLVPLNESVPIHRFPASQLLWAQRVLGSVRLK